MATSGSIEIPLAAEWAHLRRERIALRERIDRLEEERGRVSEAVLERVRADYLRRQADFDARSADLAGRAQQEVASLTRAADRQEEAVQRLRFELEEFDLRERVGETLDAVAARRAADLRRELASLEADLAALVELRQGVSQIADGRSASHMAMPLRAPAPPPAPPASFAPSAPAAPPAVAAPAAPTLDPRSAAMSDAISAAELLPPIPPLSMAHEAAGYRPKAAPPPQRPRLESPESPDGADAVALSGVTIVGRTPESGLRLPVGTVSRRHAELEPTAEGWVVRDLHSENGTWVNGERIWEKLLADGDRVQFGSVALIFRLY